MNIRLNSLGLTLAAAALLSACSRPVATFQPSKTERFYTQQTLSQPPVSAENDESAMPIREVDNVPAQPAPATQSLSEASDALVSLKATQATDKRLIRRIEKAQTMLAEANRKLETRATNVPAANTLTTKKASLLERMTLKSLDKKIRKHVAPGEKMALTGYVRLGLIIAAVGLILLLIGNSLGTLLGLIGVIGGLALVVVGLLQQ